MIIPMYCSSIRFATVNTCMFCDLSIMYTMISIQLPVMFQRRQLLYQRVAGIRHRFVLRYDSGLQIVFSHDPRLLRLLTTFILSS